MILQGDIIEVCKTIPDNTFHGILSDPPYGLKFMSNKWDYELPSVETFFELLRVCRPGAYVLFFGGSRTFHRLACNIEDAGWEIRDTIMWLHGSGFPKSMDISKAIDKSLGEEREKLENPLASKQTAQGKTNALNAKGATTHITPMAVSNLAKQYDGYGTVLKPAFEPIIICRKPLEGTVVENVTKWGCGGINIDGCRVEYSANNPPIPQLAQGKVEINSDNKMYGRNSFNESKTKSMIGGSLKGRFPANIIHDGSDEVENLFPQTKSGKPSGTQNKGMDSKFKMKGGQPLTGFGYEGSASRFFYCAKSSPSERGEGNNHPCVKPIALCAYLAKLIKPPVEEAHILIPFSGSGSEIIGSIKAGWKEWTGIEREKEYCDIANKRIVSFTEQGVLF